MEPPLSFFFFNFKHAEKYQNLKCIIVELFMLSQIEGMHLPIK